MVRITQSLLSNQALFSLQRSMQRYITAQEMVSTGRKINQAGDDPVGFPIALSLRESIQQGRTFKRNVESANSNLELTETTLNSVTETLQTIRELTVQGASSLDVNARIALAEQVSELYGHILDLSNTNYSGQSLFGGSTTKGDSFTSQNGAVIYNGDDYERNVRISKQANITANVTGLDTFMHTPNRITGSVSIANINAPLSEQLKLANPNFPNLPSIPSKPSESQSDPSPNPNNYKGETPNNYATFQIYGTEVSVDITKDSLQDVVNRINATVKDVEARIDDRNCLMITSKRSDDLDIQDGSKTIGFEPETPTGLNLLSALGMNRQVDGTRSLNRGYPATDPLTDGTVSPAPTRSAVRVEASSFLFVASNTGPDGNPAVPFGDNLALTNVDEKGNDAFLVSGDPDFIDELEALRITIDDEVIDLDLRSLTQGRDFDGIAGNEDDVPGSTLGDLVELINNHPQLQGKATAYINPEGTGLKISAIGSTEVFKVEDVRRLYGRDITRNVEVDPLSGDVTVTNSALLTMDTRLDDLPGALVDPATGSLGIRRDETDGEPSLNRGLMTITNDGESEAIDLREAETLGDVIRAINNSKVGVEARINSSGTGIDLVSLKPGDGKLSVVDMFEGTVARDLGLFSPPAPTRIQSVGGLVETDAVSTVFPTVSNGTFEIEVRDGSGAVLDTYSIEVDTSIPDGDTIESLMKKIDAADGKSGPGGGLISASIIGGVLNIVSNYDGNTISIDPANDTTGTDAATRITNLMGINQYTYTLEADTPAMVPYESKQNTASILGVRHEGEIDEIEGKNVFRTLQNLERALRNDDTEGISQALEDIDIDLEVILNERTLVGARINRLESAKVTLEDGEDFLRQELSNIEDADLALAISEMTLAQNAFNAALAASAQVIQKSLMDFLR